MSKQGVNFHYTDNQKGQYHKVVTSTHKGPIHLSNLYNTLTNPKYYQINRGQYKEKEQQPKVEERLEQIQQIQGQRQVIMEESLRSDKNVQTSNLPPFKPVTGSIAVQTSQQFPSANRQQSAEEKSSIKIMDRDSGSVKQDVFQARIASYPGISNYKAYVEPNGDSENKSMAAQEWKLQTPGSEDPKSKVHQSHIPSVIGSHYTQPHNFPSQQLKNPAQSQLKAPSQHWRKYTPDYQKQKSNPRQSQKPDQNPLHKRYEYIPYIPDEKQKPDESALWKTVVHEQNSKHLTGTVMRNAGKNRESTENLIQKEPPQYGNVQIPEEKGCFGCFSPRRRGQSKKK